MLRQHEAESPPIAVADPVGERLLRARTIIISGEISQRLAATVSAQLPATRFTISSASSGRGCA